MFYWKTGSVVMTGNNRATLRQPLENEVSSGTILIP